VSADAIIAYDKREAFAQGSGATKQSSFLSCTNCRSYRAMDCFASLATTAGEAKDCFASHGLHVRMDFEDQRY
jgi:hypothetical protein